MKARLMYPGLVTVEPGVDGEIPVKVLLFKVDGKPVAGCLLSRNNKGWISRGFSGMTLVQEQHWENTELALDAIHFYIGILDYQIRRTYPGHLVELKEFPIMRGVAR
jgi:hypothetical protein